MLKVFRVKRLWRPFFVPIGGYGILQGVHLSPLGFAACQSKKCTNRSLVGATEGSFVSSAPTEAWSVQQRLLHPLIQESPE